MVPLRILVFPIRKGLVHQNLMSVTFPDWHKVGEGVWSFRSGMSDSLPIPQRSAIEIKEATILLPSGAPSPLPMTSGALGRCLAETKRYLGNEEQRHAVCASLRYRTLVFLMGELCSTTVEIVPVAQHGGGACSGGLIFASLRSSSFMNPL